MTSPREIGHFARTRRGEDGEDGEDGGEAGAGPRAGAGAGPGAGPEPGSALAAHVQAKVDPALTLDDIGWLQDVSGLPVVVKGVLRADDAADCLDAGAAAVWVSNHGGRQLDGAVPTAAALPEVVAATAGRAEIYVDGGIRSGTDVVKALSLGATAVMVGRPVVYGLAVGGADGVAGVLAALTDQLAHAMALCGARTLADLKADLVV